MRSMEIRPSPIAGHWYSGNSTALRAEIDTFLKRVKNHQLHGRIIGLFVPHAGYRYSGQTAAYAFKTIVGQNYDMVILLSPYHAYHPAAILSSSHHYYQTPLGNVAVNQILVASLMERINISPTMTMVSVAQDREHSLEIELPFLQAVIEKPFEILPLMIRQIDPDQADFIAECIVNLSEQKKVLVVVSTDLSHFYSQTEAEVLDREMLSQIQSFSTKNVYQTELQGKGFACGLGAVMVGMALCKKLGADKIEILNHSTSGNETGDFSSVVGYGSGVFIKLAPDVSEN